MKTFTKGPWTLRHVSGSNFAVQEFEIRGVFFDKPGVAPIFNKDASAIDGTTIFVSPQDATLIAAAPDMYQALQELDERLRKCFEQPITAEEAYDSFYQDVVSDAIAKAEGAA